jgi:hypothetical protein
VYITHIVRRVLKTVKDVKNNNTNIPTN